MFWDRYGYIEPYDTYVFGRTHQGGAKVVYKLPGGGKIQGGLGIHQAKLQQNQGMTPIAHVAASHPVGPVELGAYGAAHLDARQAPALADPGRHDVRRRPRRALQATDDRGSAYLGFGYYHMDKVLYLAPALEVMHSTGGRGLTENFLGLDDSMDGTGHMYTVATDETIRINDRVGVRAFGMADVGALAAGRRDGPAREPRPPPLPQVGRRAELPARCPSCASSARFDRVILDVYDSQNSFRVISPKHRLPARQLGRDLLPVLALLVRRQGHAAPRPGPARDRARHRRLQAPGAGRLVARAQASRPLPTQRASCSAITGATAASTACGPTCSTSWHTEVPRLFCS